MGSLKIGTNTRTINGRIHIPASKSLSNRALIIRTLSQQLFYIRNLSDADDTLLFIQILKQIKEQQYIDGIIRLDANNAGTVYRFVTALLAITPGTWLLTGSERMKERPVNILANTLVALGADIDYVEEAGFPPLKINGTKITGGHIHMDSSVSSQFISAMLMIGPTLQKGLSITLKNKISSRPYIEMTLGLMEHFGIQSDFTGNKINIKPQPYFPRDIVIESDWSSAAFWYELVAFAAHGEILLEGLQKNSLQGDSVLPSIFESFGVKTVFEKEGIRLTKTNKRDPSFEYDFTHCPDLAQPVIVTCAGLSIPGKFTGLESLRIKETDRLNALKSELSKLGVICKVDQGSGFRIQGLKFPVGDLSANRSNTIHPHGDHRMAMAFAPLALLFKSIEIQEPHVVSKSYPGFWNEMEKAGFKIT